MCFLIHAKDQGADVLGEQKLESVIWKKESQWSGDNIPFWKKIRILPTVFPPPLEQGKLYCKKTQQIGGNGKK
jgi:hypothetical protein